MTTFTPIASTIGGVLIGLAASAMLVLNGKVAGISGIFGGALWPRAKELLWRLLFLSGLLAGGVLAAVVHPESMSPSPRPMIVVAVAGLLVGIGTSLGNGCTSGHGVCGISRLSPRSIVATMTFMATGALTVFLARLLLSS
jgi:uncharacterized membrane protein YedE/YeeE